MAKSSDGTESPNVEVLGRDGKGRFIRGASGNPDGRPVGVKNYGTALTLAEICRELTPDLISDLMDRYKAGDENARDFLLPRIWPESPKFALSMLEMAERERNSIASREEEREDVRYYAQKEISEQIGIEEFERKYALVECFFPKSLTALLMYQDFKDEEDNKGIIANFSHVIPLELLDGAFIPGISSSYTGELAKFVMGIFYGSIVEPGAVWQALKIANYSDELIEIIFREIEAHIASKSLYNSIFSSIIVPSLRGQIEDDEIVKYIKNRSDFLVKEKESEEHEARGTELN